MKKAFGFVLVSCLLLTSVTAIAQGTTFTYQGRLAENGTTPTGNYDLTFAVFDTLMDGTLVSSTLTNTPTLVSNGLFTVTLDFGGMPLTINYKGAVAKDQIKMTLDIMGMPMDLVVKKAA